MWLAHRTGERFLDLLQWHPRDVETRMTIMVAEAERQAAEHEEQEREKRFAAMRDELQRQRLTGG